MQKDAGLEEETRSIQGSQTHWLFPQPPVGDDQGPQDFRSPLGLNQQHQHPNSSTHTYIWADWICGGGKEDMRRKVKRCSKEVYLEVPSILQERNLWIAEL